MQNMIKLWRKHIFSNMKSQVWKYFSLTNDRRLNGFIPAAIYVVIFHSSGNWGKMIDDVSTGGPKRYDFHG